MSLDPILANAVADPGLIGNRDRAVVPHFDAGFYDLFRKVTVAVRHVAGKVEVGERR